MATIKLNDIQAFRLYTFLTTQGKGGPHLRRMDRLRKAWDIDRIEDAFEANQEVVDSFTADGKPTPKARLTVFRVDESPHEIDIAEPDLDKVWHRVEAAWGKEIEPDLGREVEPRCNACGHARETQDPRIHLAILDELERAWKEADALRAAPKTTTVPTKGHDGTEDARPT